MRYGAMNFPIKPVLEELDRIHELGFDYFELSLDPPCAHYSQVNRQAGELMQALEDYSMGLVCHLPTFVYTADLAPAIRETCINEMIESIKTAVLLKAEKAVLHPSIFSGLGPLVPDQSMALAYETLDTLVQEAERRGLLLCFENMFPRYHSFYLPEHFLPVVEKYPELQLTLDTGHANIEDPAGERLLTFLEQFAGCIGHIHVSDNNGRHDEHLETGKGKVDFGKFTAMLKQKGYDKTITFEIFSPDPKALVASRNHIDKLLQSC